MMICRFMLLIENQYQGIEALEIKTKEAIDSLQAHSKRLKNVITNDPIKNKIDENWKISIQAKDMLAQKPDETCGSETIKNTNVKSVPLQKDQESKSQNRTIRISNLGWEKASYQNIVLRYDIKVTTKEVNGRLEHSDSGQIHIFRLFFFKIYFRFVISVFESQVITHKE